VEFQTATYEEIESLDPMAFPLCHTYLSEEFHGLYKLPEFQWLEVIGSDIGDGIPVIAVLCITNNRILPNSLHISVFEVQDDLCHRGIGSQIMEKFIKTVKDLNYGGVITLQIRTPELKNFYKKFGFRESRVNNLKFLRLYLTK
jgi:GNAT superfamily N-acetyltransferase